MRFPIDTIADNLMLPVEQMRENGLQEQMVSRIVRIRDIYNYMLRNPLKKDREYLDYIQGCYKDADGKPISRRTAYEDIEILHAIVGNLQQCSKEWHRWRFNNMIMEGYAIAVRKGDAAAIAKLAQQYGKYNRLDKSDERDNGLSEVPHIVFTFDVSKLGFKPLVNAYREIDRLIKHYGGTPMESILEDTDYVEIAEEPQKEKADPDTQPIS